MTATTSAGLIGRPLLRREDIPLLRGRGHYIDDVQVSRPLYAAYVRSPHAHARVRSLDAGRAAKVRGVRAVLTGADIGGEIGPAAMVWRPADIEVLVPDSRPLLSERVACVGAPIALVLAEDPYVAEDAADAVTVSYEPLPACVDPVEALQEDAPLVHPELGTNKCFELTMGGGDLKGGFAKADVVVCREIVNHRIAAAPMEPRGVVAEPRGDGVVLWTSTQNPHLVRAYVARQLGWDEARLRVICPDVGGGFGCKANAYGEEVLATWCAARFGRAVKWIESRPENLVSTNHGRAQRANVELAATREGRLTALRIRTVADLGAYHLLFTPYIPTITAVIASGCYDIPALSTTVVGAFTNTFSTDAVRGAGRPEGTHMIELMVDQVAAELGLDPVEVRRSNFIPRERFPAERPHGPVYDSGDYHGSLDKLLGHLDLPRLRREQAELRARGVHRGIGFSTYMESAGLGPSKIAGPSGNGLEVTFWESAVVRVATDGTVTVQTGVCPAGQGHETTFAQLVADRIGAEASQVKVVWGDTDAVPNGMGTYGSRSIAVGGEAAAIAADRVVAKARRLVAELLEASVEDVELAAGRFTVRGSPGMGMTLAEVAQAAHVPDRLAGETEPGLEASCFFDPPGFVHPFGAHAAVVEVDIETGGVKIVRYVAVDDCGRVINPQLVEGQIHGGIAQAAGQALLERIEFGRDGQPLTTSLLDYQLPSAAELPELETDRTETPSPHNSLGAKGAGEAGTIAATPALVNAVIDALRPLGVEFVNMPLTPETIWRAIRAASGSFSGSRVERLS
jgi:aerobic carbon-monoxide dehydrogenase large subunit